MVASLGYVPIDGLCKDLYQHLDISMVANSYFEINRLLAILNTLITQTELEEQYSRICG